MKRSRSGGNKFDIGLVPLLWMLAKLGPPLAPVGALPPPRAPPWSPPPLALLPSRYVLKEFNDQQ